MSSVMHLPWWHGLQTTGPVTCAKSVYEDDKGYLIVVSLPSTDPQRLRVTWRTLFLKASSRYAATPYTAECLLFKHFCKAIGKQFLFFKALALTPYRGCVGVAAQPKN